MISGYRLVVTWIYVVGFGGCWVVWVGNLLDFRLLFGCLGLVVDGGCDCRFWVGILHLIFGFDYCAWLLWAKLLSLW